ncbi:sialate O-acetylesterase [Cohnella yongneupensis]|uniref:Sialate O-acetylesterase n=1 Tax=Cohnella yongneupensis TaxID=425006 RepID=A0ABW0R4H9_9BACL
MENKIDGIVIEQGPAAWTVLQHKNGFASMTLQGNWHLSKEYDPARLQAFARVVLEASGEVVVAWQPCEMAPGQQWRIALNVPVGGLYRIETCLRMRKDDPAMEWPVRGDMIHHVGVGDIWVIAGQSNAAGYGRGEYDDAPEMGVHMLRLNGRWDLATHPLNDPTDTMFPANREWSNPAHSPFLKFGKLLKRSLGYPIGLLPAALGGSHLRSWNPEESGELYRNMQAIVRHAGGSVRGVVWYQGCSDANVPESGEAETYYDRFETFTNRLREDLGDSALPILTVQLNRLIGWETSDALDRCWGKVRDAQRRAAINIPGVGIVPSIDCRVCDNIHNGPIANRTIGERLADVALKAVYGTSARHGLAPNAIKAHVAVASESGDGGRAEIAVLFEDVKGHLLSHTKEDAFAVEDAFGRIAVQAWRIEGPSEVRLVVDRLPQGDAFVHGAFETNPAYYVPFDDATGWPMLSFYGLRIEGN